MLSEASFGHPDNGPPHVFARDNCAVIQLPFENCRVKATFAIVVGIEPAATRITASNPTTVM